MKTDWNAEFDLNTAVMVNGRNFTFLGATNFACGSTMKADTLINIKFMTAVGVKEKWQKI